MTIWLWGLVVLLAAAMFGLGCIVTRASLLHRADRNGGHLHDKLSSNRRANAVLAVFFTVLAVTIAVDTVYLQVRFARFTHDQVDCNTRLIRREVVISKQRENVDRAATDYDLAMALWLARIRQSTEVGAEPVGLSDAAYIHVQSKLSDLDKARIDMLHIYTDNQFIDC